MHLLMILVTLSLVYCSRRRQTVIVGTLAERWRQSLKQFLLPPLLLLMTAIAILSMGPYGQMVWGWEGWLSYQIALAFLSLAIALGLKLSWEARQTLKQIHCHTKIDLEGKPARLLDTSQLYCAQVGFWQPELVVSQGLLDRLNKHHLEAVLVHEQMHVYHRDTFWFFWLGWLRRLSLWLPQTVILWQELLTLRELRADRSAAQCVDPLLLAESLLLVVSAPLLQPEISAALSWVIADDHDHPEDCPVPLIERIEALLAEPKPEPPLSLWSYTWVLWVPLPLAAIPFHQW
jgi:Zn-dependent protease with chaperone function